MENGETDHEEEVVEKMTSCPRSEVVEDEGLVSSSTLEKVAAAKKYIEDHYNKRMRHIQQRKERWKLVSAHHLFVYIPNRTTMWCSFFTSSVVLRAV